MKRLFFFNILFSLFLIVTSFFYVQSAYAQEQLTYTFIERLPFIGESLASNGPGTLLVQYLGNVYTIILGAAAILALIMIVVGGVQYTYVALSPSAKNDAKTRIYNALVGLLIVLGAYLILNTINPDLVRLDLSITRIQTSGNTNSFYNSIGLGGVGGNVTNEPIPGGGVIGTPGVEVPWSAQREQEVRDRLLLGGVDVNRPNACGGRGSGHGCTDVGGLTDSTIDQVIVFNQQCQCNVVVSGGSEPGHETHTDGQYAYRSVDISKTRSGSTLNDYIYRNGTKIENGCPVSKSWDAYVINGAYYCDENSAHWHVIYP